MQGFAVFNTIEHQLGRPDRSVAARHAARSKIVGPSGRIRPFQWLDQETRRALLVPTTVPCYGHKAYIVRPAEHDGTGPVTHAGNGHPDPPGKQPAAG